MWWLTGYEPGDDDPAFERELPSLTTDEVRAVTDETGIHPWSGSWPVEGDLLALVRLHAPKGLGLERRECLLEWRD